MYVCYSNPCFQKYIHTARVSGIIHRKEEIKLGVSLFQAALSRKMTPMQLPQHITTEQERWPTLLTWKGSWEGNQLPSFAGYCHLCTWGRQFHGAGVSCPACMIVCWWWRSISMMYGLSCIFKFSFRQCSGVSVPATILFIWWSWLQQSPSYSLVTYRLMD